MTTVTFRGRADWADGEHDHAAVAGLVARLTLEEKIALVSAPMAADADRPADAHGSAAHHPGVPRVGIPAWDESDASLGVTNPNEVRGPDDEATAFPSLAALGATFDVALAEEMGRAVGAEARQKGFTVQLAGGVNLVREPRGGRIFEYVGEDVLLSGLLAGAATRGIQAEGVVSTLKHFAINPQETGRVMVSSDIGERPLRESDLLAFEIALEHGGARMIMPGYTMVNKVYAAENAFLLHEVLKGDWRYPGATISDWGATHSTTHAAWAGLDRQSGYGLDTAHYFGEPLRRAVLAGRVDQARLDDMVTRILAALQHVGALDVRRRPGPVDLAAHAPVAARVAIESVVLLVNRDDTLPLAPKGGRIVVLGDFADAGVLAGGGSSTVTPPDAHRSAGLDVPQMTFPKIHHPPAPLDRIAAAFPGREVVHLDRGDVGQLTGDDVAVVTVEKWATEGRDAPDLALGDGQDELVSSAAARAGRTVVVIESAGPVLLPWLAEVDAVLAACYGGQGGADAIAGALSGAVNPAGRLPVTWPAGEADLPRPELPDPETTTSFPGEPRVGDYLGIDYDIEGADVGYRWHERTGRPPLFWFGHGLSYTTFAWSDVAFDVAEASDHEGAVPRVTLTVTNTGDRAGIDTPQVYVAPPRATDATAGAQPTYRLAGFARVRLTPGESATVTLLLDEDRVYSTYDPDDPGWRLAAGAYRIRLARDAGATPADGAHEATVTLPGRICRYDDFTG